MSNVVHASSSQIRSATPTVLVVDDDPLMRDLLQTILRKAGISVQIYASAQELLATADLNARSLLLLDVMMPGMSGLELQALLRRRGHSIPIVFLTGSSDVPMAVTAMRNGAADFIEKPFYSDQLIQRVRRAFNTRIMSAALDEHRAQSEHARRLATLTSREREVIDLMITGKTSKMIARDLGGSFRTIEIHRARVMNKMAAANLADLVRMNLNGNGKAHSTNTYVVGAHTPCKE